MPTRILIPKGRSNYYYRFTFPRKLRHYFSGRVQLWRALRTDDVIEARKQADQWDLRVQRVLIDLKLQGEKMTKAEIDNLVARWLETSLDEAEDHRAVCGSVTDQYRDDVTLILSDQDEAVSEALISCDYTSVQDEADQLLQKSGFPTLDHQSPAFGRLCRRLLMAKQEYLRIEADRWEGRNYPQPAVQQRHMERMIERSAYPTAVSRQQQGPLCTECVKKYLIENPRSVRTIGPVTAEFKKFIETIGGDKPVAAITKADCRVYKEHLLQVRKVKLATVTKHLTTLSGFFRWAEGQGYRPEGSPNPIKGLTPQNKFLKKEALQRRPFTDAELLTLFQPRGGDTFASRDFTKQKDAHPERYWVVLLCLFQVCRLEEAAQLNVADIKEQDGIPCMRITDEGEGQALKNAGSKRTLPLHSSLIQLGFLEYVKRIKKAGHPRLFPQLKKGPNGYGTRVGKAFSILVTKSGLTDPALVLHSLRHGGIYKLHAAGAPHNVVEVLAGHTASGVHGKVYEHRELLPMSLLRDGLEKLRYEEVVQVLTK